MRHRSHPEARPSSAPTLGDRLLAAVLTPLFFNLGLIICAAVLSPRGRMLGRLLYMYAVVSPAALLFIALPAVVGFVLGSKGAATLFGHAFWTHPAPERSMPHIATIWGVIGLCFYLSLRGLHH